MSDDRLAGIINAHYRRDDVPYVGVEDEAIDAADAIRAAVAADPTIVGMSEVDPTQAVMDIASASRSVRGASWPGEMAERMDKMCDRLDMLGVALAMRPLYRKP